MWNWLSPQLWSSLEQKTHTLAVWVPAHKDKLKCDKNVTKPTSVLLWNEHYLNHKVIKSPSNLAFKWLPESTWYPKGNWQTSHTLTHTYTQSYTHTHTHTHTHILTHTLRLFHIKLSKENPSWEDFFSPGNTFHVGEFLPDSQGHGHSHSFHLFQSSYTFFKMLHQVQITAFFLHFFWPIEL